MAKDTSTPVVTAGGSTRYTDAAPWQSTAGYSRAIRRGDLIAVSGTTAAEASAAGATPPTDAHATDATGAHATYDQAVDAMTRTLAAVTALGGAPADVVRTRVYLAPEADWEAAARAHRETFGDVAPANTMLHVHAMIGDGLLVEVEAEALVLGDREGGNG